jgi:predicted RNase H-like HicB family nuclease
MAKQRRRLFAYPMNIAHDGDVFIGELPDWPECDPGGSTRETLCAGATISMFEMVIARMRDGEPVPLLGSAPRGWENEVLVKLPWRLRLNVVTYEAMRRVRELVSR